MSRKIRNLNVVNGGHVLQRKLKKTIILNKYDLKWKETSERCKREHRTRKENIVQLMKTVFEEEIAKQQQQISKIIENNLVITKQEIGKLREEINDLKKSIEFTENVLEEKVAKVEQNVFELQGKFKKVEEDVYNIHERLHRGCRKHSQ